jgi:uncharacterized membrane protein
MFPHMKLVNTNVFRCPRALRVILSAAVCCLLLLLSFPGAARAADYQPDLMLRLASEVNFLGENAFEPVAAIQSKSQAAFSGSPANYVIKLKNAGALPDSFQIRGTGSGSAFTVSYGGGINAARPEGFRTATLQPGATLVFSVQVTPAPLPLGAVYPVSIEAVSNNAATRVADQVKTETIACGSTAALTLSAPEDGFGQPGEVVTYHYTLTNVGDANNSFSLSAVLPPGWSGVLHDKDGRVTAATGDLAAGTAYPFDLLVTVPPGLADGARGDALVSATDHGAASGADLVTTSATTATISVVESVRNLTQGGPFSPSAQALPGEILEYRMAVTNSGTKTATALAIRCALPAYRGSTGVTSLASVPASLRVLSSAAGEGTCAADCGWARESGGSITAHLGAGATETSGGSLPPRQTLYVFFRVQVE